eukprot:scaffold3849_cov179-Amphora_coffeaeformis.AAC.22
MKWHHPFYRVATIAATRMHPPPNFSIQLVRSPNKRRPKRAVKTGSMESTTLVTVAETVACALCCNKTAKVPGPAALYNNKPHARNPFSHPFHWDCPEVHQAIRHQEEYNEA